MLKLVPDCRSQIMRDTYPELSETFGPSHTTMAVSMALSVLTDWLLTHVITGSSTSMEKEVFQWDFGKILNMKEGTVFQPRVWQLNWCLKCSIWPPKFIHKHISYTGIFIGAGGLVVWASALHTEIRRFDARFFFSVGVFAGGSRFMLSPLV